MADEKALGAILSSTDDDMWADEDGSMADEINPEDLAVDEMMDALQANDKAAFKEALRSFIDLSRMD